MTSHSRWRWTHFAHDTLLPCRGMRKRLSFVVIWLARSKHDFSPRNGTNGHDQPRSVPYGSTRPNRVKTVAKRQQFACPLGTPTMSLKFENAVPGRWILVFLVLVYSTRQLLRNSYFGSVSRLISTTISAEILNSSFLLGEEVQNDR